MLQKSYDFTHIFYFKFKLLNKFDNVIEFVY